MSLGPGNLMIPEKFGTENIQQVIVTSSISPVQVFALTLEELHSGVARMGRGGDKRGIC